MILSKTIPKRLLACIILLCSSIYAFSTPQPKNFSEKKVVAITQIVSHPSLDQVYEGILETLNTHYTDQNLKIIHENAQGNLSTAIQIGQKLAGIKPDIIIAISTPSAQAAMPHAKKAHIPLVFSAVSDPVAAKLIIPHQPNLSATGVIDAQPIQEQLALMHILCPKIKRLGFIYNPGEINSITILKKIKEASPYTIIEAAAPSTHMVTTAFQNTLQSIDALYIPPDNTIVSSLDSILKIAKKHNIPVFSNDPDLVHHGVLASVGVSYKNIGELTGQIAIRILDGEQAHSIPAQTPKNHTTVIHQQTANNLQITLPQELLNSPNTTIIN